MKIRVSKSVKYDSLTNLVVNFNGNIVSVDDDLVFVVGFNRTNNCWEIITREQNNDETYNLTRPLVS